MKTLEEHNRDALSKHIDLSKPVKNGIACPKCGSELVDSMPNITLASYPPQKNVACDCGFSGYRYV